MVAGPRFRRMVLKLLLKNLKITILDKILKSFSYLWTSLYFWQKPFHSLLLLHDCLLDFNLKKHFQLYLTRLAVLSVQQLMMMIHVLLIFPIIWHETNENQDTRIKFVFPELNFELFRIFRDGITRFLALIFCHFDEARSENLYFRTVTWVCEHIFCLFRVMRKIGKHFLWKWLHCWAIINDSLPLSRLIVYIQFLGSCYNVEDFICKLENKCRKFFWVAFKLSIEGILQAEGKT